jgi:hypothetical protein
MNVDSFCMKYASDELESLREIIQKDKQKRLNKYFWVFEAEHLANEKLHALKDYGDEFMALPMGNEKKFKEPCILTADIDAKSSLFFPPEYSNTNNRVEMSKNKKLALAETKIEDFSSNLEDLNEKQVLTENTRLPHNFVESMIEKQTSKMRKKIYEAYESSDVIRLLKELKEIDEQKEKDKEMMPETTPMINGYKLVKDPKLEKAAIFTYGEIASTPNILKEPRFSVPQTPKREDLAHVLANKNFNKLKKDKKDET